MEFNNDTRQVVIDSRLYNALRVLAYFGAETQEQKDHLAQIDRHAEKFNAILRIQRDGTRRELEQSTRQIIAMERRQRKLSSERHQHTFWTQSVSGRFVPCRVIDIIGDYSLLVELITAIPYADWPRRSDQVYYEHEAMEIIQRNFPDEVERYEQFMENHRVKS